MKMEVNLNDDWVDEVVAASLREFVRRNHKNSDTPIDAIKEVLKFYSVEEDYNAFIEDLEIMSGHNEGQTNLDF
jgi:hypothetical protein|tara:strand:- start:639 stop:860 length:222 start_codon:yes stop_codon:yes gene_type:complete